MRKTIGPGLAVVPTFEDMIGNPPAVKTAPPALKYSDIMDNPLVSKLVQQLPDHRDDAGAGRAEATLERHDHAGGGQHGLSLIHI